LNSITLTYGSTTQPLDAWGFTYCTLHLKSRAASLLILDRGGDDPADAPIIPYGGQITIAVTMGDGSTYYWKGKRRDFNGQANPDAPRTSLQFEDVWGALNRTTFQHFWKMNSGSGVTDVYFSRLNLFQDISAGPGVAWTYLDAHDQIVQIVDFAQTNCGLPVQCGTVDPVWNMPVFAVKAISCAYALQLVMKPMPDMVTAMDYSTTPPTVHFRQRQNCTPVTLPFAGTDAQSRHHKQTQIKPRPDLQVPAVVIQYQITGTVDGVEYNDTSVDAFPPGATGLEENALVFPVDLRGPSRTDVKATLVTEAVDPTTTAFWKEHKPDLANTDLITFDATNPIVDTTINGGSGHENGITILDATGATVTLSDYPNKLLSGQPAQWMISPDGVTPVDTVEVTIRGTLRYKKYFPLDTGTPPTNKMLTHTYENHVVEVRMRLCDAPAGTTNYSVTGSSDSGDPLPLHLAYALWCAINNVPVNYVGGIATPPATVPAITAPDNFQWEGEHEIVENNIYSIITPANTLNLSGGNADWAGMNAVIYAVDIDFFNGRTNISFGPFKHLQAAEYFEMIMAFRYRQVFDNPNLRNTGQSGGAGSTDLGKDSPKENTNHGTPDANTDMVHAADATTTTSRVQIVRDAVTNNGEILIQTVKNDTTVDTAKPLVQLSQSDLGTVNDAGTTGRVAKWRKLICLDTSGNTKQFVVAASDEETTSVTIGGALLEAPINTVSGNPDIYANYFIVNAGSVTTAATFSGSVTSITVASATGIAVGQVVSGTHIAAQTTVTSVSGTTIGISNATTGTSSGNYTFSSLVRVAKNAKLRNSITGETIDSVTWSYTYGASSPYASVARKATATISGNSYTEYQVIVPRYLAGDEIWYIPVANGQIGGVTSVPDTISSTAGANVVFMDINADGRAWAASAGQAGYE
jgi:hypothetical protein